jgi:predicted helicase
LSIQLINQYYTKRDKLIQFGGSKNELSIRDAFKDLLNHYAEKFNTYRFSDYKEHVIELLKKVTTVSVETMKIIREMEKIKE